MAKELESFRSIANSRRSRKQPDKVLPSGEAPGFVYENSHIWGGEDCLIPVEHDVVANIMERLRPEFEQLTSWGTTDEFTEKVEEALQHLPANTIEDMTIGNVWVVFTWILPHLDWEDEARGGDL